MRFSEHDEGFERFVGTQNRSNPSASGSIVLNVGLICAAVEVWQWVNCVRSGMFTIRQRGR